MNMLGYIKKGVCLNRTFMELKLVSPSFCSSLSRAS